MRSPSHGNLAQMFTSINGRPRFYRVDCGGEAKVLSLRSTLGGWEAAFPCPLPAPAGPGPGPGAGGLWRTVGHGE